MDLNNRGARPHRVYRQDFSIKRGGGLNASASGRRRPTPEGRHRSPFDFDYNKGPFLFMD